jgi:hypothetical protein
VTATDGPVLRIGLVLFGLTSLLAARATTADQLIAAGRGHRRR